MDSYLEKVTNELKLRGYSRKTVKAYTSSLRQYLNFLHSNHGGFDKNTVKQFLLSKLNAGLSARTVNLHLNAIKFLYRNVLNKRLDIKCAKRPQKLPVVLSRREILKIIDSIENKKHKLLIALAYGAGLRVSEVVSLKVVDVDFGEFLLNIRGGKGNKDRITLLPEKLIKNIESICLIKDKNDYLFESERGGKLTTRTAQKIFERALFDTGIKKNATFHSLRHSFATHLMENCINIRYVQELLGHRNIKTTQRYTQVTKLGLRNVKSPL